MRKVTHISIHCSATPSGSALAYDKYHREHNGWSSIGYHYVISNGNNGNGYNYILDGQIESGRPEHLEPAAVKGFNHEMIAICLTGSRIEDFTLSQFESLRLLLIQLSEKYGVKEENIRGHREYGRVTKECPCFNVRNFIKDGTIRK